MFNAQRSMFNDFLLPNVAVKIFTCRKYVFLTRQ